MSEVILQTKLYKPALRPTLVARPKLFEKIDAGLSAKLTLVAAPAGYGKTTLVASWVAQHTDTQVAWLVLDSNDNDPQTFFSYFLAAIRPFAPLVTEQLQPLLLSSMPHLDQLIPLLLNGLAELPQPLVLVLDDYDVISNPIIQESMARLLDFLPPTVHLILTTRRDPPLPLARYRVRGELQEIRVKDLQFDAGETNQFLSERMGVELHREDIDTLTDRTEGWIASLQLAALSLQALDQLQDRQQFVRSFGGSYRYVADYLLDEVLAQQTPETRDFLLKTSILPQVNAELANLLTGGKNGQTMLETLDQANFFIIPLDEQRRWYRHHHLMSTLLQQRLVKLYPDQVTDLYRQAVAWFEKSGYPADAIKLALQGKLYQEAARLLSRIDNTALWQHGHYARLAYWIEQLPQEILAQRPQICVYYAWGLLVDANRSDAATAARYLDMAEQHSSGETAEEHDIRGQIAAIRALRTRVQAQIDQTLELVDYALQNLRADSTFWRALAYFDQAAVNFLGDDVTATQEALDRSVAALAGSVDNLMFMAGKNMGGQLFVRQGELHQAEQRFKEALDYEGRQGSHSYFFTAGMSLLGLGALQREWNDLEKAADYLRRGLAVGRQTHNPLTLVAGHLTLAQLLQNAGHEQEAVQQIEESLALAGPTGIKWTWLTGPLVAAVAQLWLRLGHVEKARQVLHTARPRVSLAPERCAFWDEQWNLALARLLMAERKWPEALDLLLRLAGSASAKQRIGSKITILVPMALTYEQLGRREEAVGALAAAVILARPSGYIRVFLDEGQELASLMAQLPERMPGHLYRDQLLASFTGQAMLVDQSALVEPLSDRELQILRLMAARLSNREIGEELFLATTTIKWYSTQIYGKLGVNNRREAVQKARELGVL